MPPDPVLGRGYGTPRPHPLGAPVWTFGPSIDAPQTPLHMVYPLLKLLRRLYDKNIYIAAISESESKQAPKLLVLRLNNNIVVSTSVVQGS